MQQFYFDGWQGTQCTLPRDFLYRIYDGTSPVKCSSGNRGCTADSGPEYGIGKVFRLSTPLFKVIKCYEWIIPMHTMDVRLPCHASFCFREFDFLRPTSTKKYVNFTGTMTIVKRLLSRLTHRLYDIPVLVLMPHSRCNCRCVMCDIWKANHEKKELSTEWLQRNSEAFERLGVREVVLSGGEALMHSNLWNFCNVLRERRMRVVILSTGLLLEKYAAEIVANLNEVIISLDGSREVHDRIRNIPRGFEKISLGVGAIKKINPSFRITARSVVQRENCFDFMNTVRAARAMGLDAISFLAADVST